MQKGKSSEGNYKRRKTVAVNCALLVSAIGMSISGLIIQCHYHLLKSPGESFVFALDRAQWNAVHVWSSIFFLIGVIYHIWAHSRWYEQVLRLNFHTRHRSTVILTVLTVSVVISGLIPLSIHYFDGNSALRLFIVEIHDKIAILFFVVALRHVIKRFRWYVRIFQ